MLNCFSCSFERSRYRATLLSKHHVLAAICLISVLVLVYCQTIIRLNQKSILTLNRNLSLVLATIG